MSPNSRTLVAWNLHPAQWAGWISNRKACSLVPETCSLYHAPQNNKTIVENKAYKLTNEIIKLMTSKTGAHTHTHKTVIYGKVTFQNERTSLYWHLKIFFQSVTTVLAWLYREGYVNLPALPGGGTDDGNMMSTQERQRRSAPPISFSNYKNITHWGTRAASTMLACQLVNLTSVLF